LPLLVEVVSKLLLPLRRDDLPSHELVLLLFPLMEVVLIDSMLEVLLFYFSFVVV
jgi:hypothetical protein